MKSLITRFIKNESGATAIEYGLIAAGLAVVVVAIFGGDGVVEELMSTLFQNVADTVTSVATS